MKVFMFESIKDDVISIERFISRLWRSYLAATFLLILSLVPDVLGFYYIESNTFKEALINSLSILRSISPPFPASTGIGRLFTAIFGLFSETVFLVTLAILVAPVIHHVYHRLHIDTLD